MNQNLRGVIFGYGTASLVQGAVGFLVVPLLILILGQKAFTYWVMLEPLVAILAGLSLLGVHYGHLYGITTKLLTSGAALRQVMDYGWLPALLIAFFGGVAACLFIGLGNNTAILLLCVIYVLAEACILMFQFHTRALSDALTYASTVWLRSASILSGLILFKVTGLRIELAYYFLFMIVVDGIVLIVIIWRYRDKLRAARVEYGQMKKSYTDAVRYGLPVMLAATLAMFVGSGDRYVLHLLMASEQLPAYLVMAKLAGAMSFAMAPINLWWPVARNQHIQDVDRGSQFFSNVMPVLLAYYFLAAVAIWMASSAMIVLYAPGVHGINSNVFFLLLLSGVASGMSTPANVGMLTPGKTHWMIVLVGLSALVGLGFSFILIPSLGFLGAALATLFGQVTNLVLIFAISQKILKIEFEYVQLVVVLLIGGAITLALLLNQDNWRLQLISSTAFFSVIFFALRGNLKKLLVI
jgi:O-antigen/teichoic acid export membrane protein